MLRMTKKKAAVVGGVSAALVTGGVAFAYWTSDGTGTGSVTTGDSVAWEVTVDSTDLAGLTPGGPGETVSFHVKNNNTGVQALQNTVATVVDTSDSGCTDADFDVSATTITYGDVAAGDTVDGTFEITMINRAANQDACKDVTVNLEVDAS